MVHQSARQLIPVPYACRELFWQFPANSYHIYTVELAQGQRSQRQPFAVANEDETAVHGCHCPGDMAVRMRKVLAIPYKLESLWQESPNLRQQGT